MESSIIEIIDWIRSTMGGIICGFVGGVFVGSPVFAYQSIIVTFYSLKISIDNYINGKSYYRFLLLSLLSAIMAIIFYLIFDSFYLAPDEPCCPW